MKEVTLLDYIIVGQGLAGSAVALQLLKQNKKILVFDEPDANAASRVAAGLFNPVTGKNNTKTWMADQLFPYLHNFYQDAEHITGSRFFHPMPIYRPFASVHEQNDWMGKSADPAYQDFVEAVHLEAQYSNMVRDSAGGLRLKRSGYLDTSSYLVSVRGYLRSRGNMLEQYFDEEQLLPCDGQVNYLGWRARKIIFCQGEKVLNGKWFKDLPINPLKGETLTIKTAWQKHVILNRGVFMVPGTATEEFKVGSTYRTDDRSRKVTDVARHELEQKLADLLMIPFKVHGQSWGFRPTTPDRKPILGAHAKYEQFVIFNGLGTKGVSLAPYFSEVLVRWLEHNEPLNKQVSVTRYN